MSKFIKSALCWILSFTNTMFNKRRPGDGLEQRFVSLEVGVEIILSKPLIKHDNSLYWRIFKALKIAPVTKQGCLLSTLDNG